MRRSNRTFEFLGFHHHLMESWKWQGRWYLHSWPSDRAMTSIRSKISELTNPRNTYADIAFMVGRLNRREGCGKRASALRDARRWSA